ncbi:MAG: tagaturonate epimerase family protein [Kiritimatiellia bacterium]
MKQNAVELREKHPFTRPSVLSAGPIIGLGYRPPWRLGNVCQARFAARHGLRVMLAQQSAREIERTGRSFQDVIDSASTSAFEGPLEIPWGADGDHLRNESEVTAAARAGCTHFTYDVTADLKEGFDAVVEKVVKLNGLTHQVKDGRKFTTEISLDEGEATTSLEEVARLLAVLKDKQVVVDEIAPRFPGYFEKAIDYYREIKDGRHIRDTADFEIYLKQLAESAAAHHFRVCIHSGSDKFSIYPIVAEILKKNFHLKTAGTYYLEDLKIVARHDLGLFLEIYAHSSAQFARDRATYELSAKPEDIPDLQKLSGAEIARLLQSGAGDDNLRQVLHVTYGSILTARGGEGKPLFAGRIEKVLRDNFVEYQAELFQHLERHFKYFFGSK